MQALSAQAPRSSVTITEQAPQSPSLQPFLGAGEPALLPEPVEQGARRRRPVETHDLAVEEEADGRDGHGATIGKAPSTSPMRAADASPAGGCAASDIGAALADGSRPRPGPPRGTARPEPGWRGRRDRHGAVPHPRADQAEGRGRSDGGAGCLGAGRGRAEGCGGRPLQPGRGGRPGATVRGIDPAAMGLARPGGPRDRSDASPCADRP